MLLSNRQATIIVFCLILVTALVIVTFTLHPTVDISYPSTSIRRVLSTDTGRPIHWHYSDNINDSCTKCQRPVPYDGIEDLFCMKQPHFIPTLKNPCWFEKHRLKCLPFFHILGCAKCATTDLTSRLSLHPDIVGPDGAYNKETLWWSWRRYGHLGYKRVPISNFKRYVKYFNPVAKLIEAEMKKRQTNYSQLITFDGSPPDFWDFRSWPLLPQNHKKKVPCVLTPQLMNHIYKNPKFILIFRNPTERLFSSYLFHRMGETAEEFEEDVKISVKIFSNCQKKHSRRECFFSPEVYNKMPTRLHFGCYSMFLKEWLSMFQRSQFLILKTEEYTGNITHHMEQIFSFLKLRPVSSKLMRKMQQMTRSRVTNLKSAVGNMLTSTRQILDNFYASCNRELAHMLGDDKFLWK